MANMHPLKQAILDSEPLTAAEVKELLIRHILSSPHDPRNYGITACLARGLQLLWVRDHTVQSDLVAHDQARDILKDAFISSFLAAFPGHPRPADFYVWPASMGTDGVVAKSVAAFVGHALGTSVGKDVKIQNDKIVNPSPSN